MNQDNKNALIKQVGAQKIISTLEPFITTERKNKIQAVLSKRLFSIQLAIEAPADINNALAAIRSCEAFGLSTIHIIAAQGTAGSIYELARGAHYWLDVIKHNTLKEFLKHPLIQGATLAGGTPQATVALHDVPINNALCLMIGNERRGLSPECMTHLQYEYHIPMVGMSESLNLSVAAAISLYDTTLRKHEQLGGSSDLSSGQRAKLHALYCLNSVSPRAIKYSFMR